MREHTKTWMNTACMSKIVMLTVTLLNGCFVQIYRYEMHTMHYDYSFFYAKTLADPSNI